jgi:hypothetical protein
VRFAYYQHLTRREQAIYRRSDQLTALPVPGADALRPAVAALEAALGAGDGAAVARASFAICAGLCRALGARPPELQIHAVRPRGETHELHGLYLPADGARPVIRVWMRTARRGQVVAPRTFLRTLLHELVHHLDLTVLGLGASLHTEGFFRRESSLFRQLVPAPARRGSPGSPAAAERSARAAARRRGHRSAMDSESQDRGREAGRQDPGRRPAGDRPPEAAPPERLPGAARQAPGSGPEGDPGHGPEQGEPDPGFPDPPDLE